MASDPTAVVVIGAGPAGLAAAARLTELGISPTVVEASNRVGGMAGSLEMWGHTVDLGPHRFFSADPVVVAFWHRYVKSDFVMISRQTRIYYEGKFYDYPLKAKNALRNLGLVKATAAVSSYVKSQAFPTKDDGSLETWVSNRFGKSLFKTFFKTYTEKLWGISCRDLDADWAAQRIQGLTLGGAIRSALQGNRGNTLKTLVDEFAYPAPGNQLLYDRLREKVDESEGGQVLLQSAVQRVRTEGGRVVGVTLHDGREIDADWVVSSMPITLLLRALPDVPPRVQEAASQLRFRNTILVYLLVDGVDLFPDQWLYIHDPNVLHGRITNFRNWSPQLIGDPKQTVVCIEYWCFDEDPIWQEDEDVLIERAKDEVSRVGLVEESTVIAGKIVRIPRCYPVYEHGYQDPLTVVTDYLDGISGLMPIGRYGAFKYNNQDHSILMGILAAESVANGQQTRLWHINTDAVYQEQDSSHLLSNQDNR